MTLSLDDAQRRLPYEATTPQPGVPRVLYVDAESDLPGLLDAVEVSTVPVILVLQDQARPLRGAIAVRLLCRRARAAGVALAVVTADRTTTVQVTAAGIPCAQTMAEARRLLAPATAEEQAENSEPQIETSSTALLEEADDSVTLRLPPYAAAVDDRPTTDVLNESGPQVRVATHRERHVAHRRRTPRRSLLILAGLAALGAAVASWAFFLPQATIVISYGTGTFDQTYQVQAGDGSAVPVSTTVLHLPGSLSVPATGTALVPYGHARGSVTFANPLNGVVVIPAGTEVTTTGGTAFLTLATVNVPSAVRSFSGTTNGQQTVQVQAVQPGPAGNVPVGAIDAIQGRLAGAVLVTNYAAVVGGTLHIIYHITAKDIAAAATVLRARLHAAAVRDIAVRYARSPARMITGAQATPPSVAPVIIHGKLYARVSLQEQITLQYLRQRDVQHFADTHRAIALSNKNLVLVPGTEHVAVAVRRTAGHFTIEAHVTGRVEPVIDLSNLRGLLAGQTISAARSLLNGSARYGAWQYTLAVNPPWFGRLPQLPSLIQITLERSPAQTPTAG